MIVPEDNEEVRKEQGGWSHSSVVAHYCGHRQAVADLYASERHFLERIGARIDSALDVGCAAGGFRKVLRQLNPRARYAGVDVTPEMIEAARVANPGVEFHVADGTSFPFPAESFDLVFCLGVLHLNRRYRSMLEAMWEQTRCYLMFDLRLTLGATTVGSLRFDHKGEGESSLPLVYNVLNEADAEALIRALQPAPKKVDRFAYNSAVSPKAELPFREAMMACYLLQKSTSPRDGSVASS